MTAAMTHRLTAADMAVMATGRGDAGLIGRLRAAQVSRRLLQLHALMTSARALPAAEVAALLAGYELAADVQERDHRSVADVLMYPSVGIWAAHCLRRLRGTITSDRPVGSDLGHLAAIAAAAAVRAGEDFEIEVPLRDGSVVLPTIGAARLSPATPQERALVRGSMGVVEVVAGGSAVTVPQETARDAPGWQGLRWLTAVAGGLTLTVAVDDIDPFRAAPDLPSAARLTDSDLRWWRRALDQAWSLLSSSHPEYANAIGAGLVALTPLAGYSGRVSMSATSREAFGACLLSMPPDAQSFAVTLVHEFQHAKLGALHDVVPLYAGGPEVRGYSPWRDDPRPLAGLLQGAYAYLGVTDFWRTQMSPGSRCEPGYAAFEFARWREQTWAATGALERSGLLTPTGRELVAGMRRRLGPWLADPVPADSAMAATMAIADHRLNWRLRNLRPDPAGVERLARSWLARGAPGTVGAAPAVMTSDRALVRSRRVDLLCHQAGGAPARAGGAADAIHAADIALVQGERDKAAELYRGLIAHSPDRRDAWTGLVLAGNWPRQSVMTRAPEFVYAMHRRVRELRAPAPDPYELSGWLDSGPDWPVTDPEIFPERNAGR